MVCTNITNFFIIPVYFQSVQVHSVNWLKEADECLGEGRSLALYVTDKNFPLQSYGTMNTQWRQ
jgi:hypothetical protein